MGVSVKILCHSKAPTGGELITIECEFHRFILAEINTHRTLSRNYQSSRAVPVEKMIEQVKNDPAIPVHWGQNQRGMVAEQELSLAKRTDSEYRWRRAAKQAATNAEYMSLNGCHKQIVNRLLEPFIWTKGVITGTKEAWEGVFKLRCHKDAQPEFRVLAEKIKAAIEDSTPRELNYGDYHTPYVDFDDPKYSIEDAVKISTSCNAQVSYRVLDDSLDKAKKLYDMLNLPEGGVYKEDPPHFSPTEHVAKVMYCIDKEDSGNFNSNNFWQYRKALEDGIENYFMKQGD